jgi:hypothetical protein
LEKLDDANFLPKMLWFGGFHPILPIAASKSLDLEKLVEDIVDGPEVAISPSSDDRRLKLT